MRVNRPVPLSIWVWFDSGFPVFCSTTKGSCLKRVPHKNPPQRRNVAQETRRWTDDSRLLARIAAILWRILWEYQPFQIIQHFIHICLQICSYYFWGMLSGSWHIFVWICSVFAFGEKTTFRWLVFCMCLKPQTSIVVRLGLGLLSLFNCAVQHRDEQRSHGWHFPLQNDKQRVVLVFFYIVALIACRYFYCPSLSKNIVS